MTSNYPMKPIPQESIFELRDDEERSPFLCGYIVGAGSVTLLAAFAWLVSLLV